MNTSTTRQGDPAQVGWSIGHAPLWLRGIRLAEGEGGATPPAPPAPPAPTPPAAPPAPSPATVAQMFAQQPAQPVAPAPAAPPTFSQEYVHELREEAKTTRIAHQELETKHQEAETARTAAETALAEAQAQLAQFQRESAVRAAAEGIANPALLLDSASFTQTLAEVSLDDTEAVKAAIQAFVEKNSAYAATSPLPNSSGGTPSGGQDATLEQQLAAAQEKGDQMEVIRITRAIAAAKRA